MTSLRARLLNLALRLISKRQLARIGDATPEVVAESRRRLQTMARWMPAPPSFVHVEPVSAGGVPAEWISAGARSDTAIMYLHGGAYTVGGPDNYRDIAWRLAAASGLPVLLVDYRLAPEHPFPAALEDAHTTWRWLTESRGVKQVCVVGDSAGGGLALSLTMGLRDLGESLPAGVIGLSPWTDLSGSGDSLQSHRDADPVVPADLVARGATLYLRETDARDPRVSPLYGDFSGLPPLQIHVGSTEVLLDDATRVANKARAAGVSVDLRLWPDMSHVFYLFASVLPEARQMVAQVSAFANEVVGAPAEPPRVT
ncbi:MAG: alpha/beta hydrolase [Gammaproteobacteria bacterium]|nr:MAG: alpha/beta hydrolase [Gammaproteobacteria bacterium]